MPTLPKTSLLGSRLLLPLTIGHDEAYLTPLPLLRHIHFGFRLDIFLHTVYSVYLGQLGELGLKTLQVFVIEW